MKAYSNWKYDEYHQVGKDYGSLNEVQVYDASHGRFRDVDSENAVSLDLLGVHGGWSLADFGCGTGAFLAAAARRGAHVLGFDVSEEMLAFAERRLRSDGLQEVELRRSGYLDSDLGAESLDAIHSSFSLHHLPDFWKGQALRRLWLALRPGGVFFLRDVVVPDQDAAGCVNRFIAKQEELGGDFLREDAVGHFREEFSTTSWIMRGLLERGGFRIEQEDASDEVVVSYLCRKQ